jgi:hypothetical protein
MREAHTSMNCYCQEGLDVAMHETAIYDCGSAFGVTGSDLDLASPHYPALLVDGDGLSFERHAGDDGRSDAATSPCKGRASQI